MSEAIPGSAPRSVTVIGTLDANGKATAASASSPVSVDRASATATVTTVNDQATSTTLLAANSSRKGFSVFNDSTAVLYMKFGTAASTSSYTVQIGAGEYWETGTINYTGRVDGIWASDQSGKAVITELT